MLKRTAAPRLHSPPKNNNIKLFGTIVGEKPYTPAHKIHVGTKEIQFYKVKLAVSSKKGRIEYMQMLVGSEYLNLVKKVGTHLEIKGELRSYKVGGPAEVFIVPHEMIKVNHHQVPRNSVELTGILTKNMQTINAKGQIRYTSYIRVIRNEQTTYIIPLVASNEDYASLKRGTKINVKGFVRERFFFKDGETRRIQEVVVLKIELG